MTDIPLVDLTAHHQPCGVRDHADDTMLRDVVLVVRADEAHHRGVNRGFASELAGIASTAAPAPYPAHADYAGIAA